MSRSCAEWRGDIGACIIGAIDDQARDRVTRHLAGCADCQEDYDELVPVRDWLGLLELAGGPPRARPAEQPRRPLHPATGNGPVLVHQVPSPGARPGSGTQPSWRALHKTGGFRSPKRFVLAAAGAALAAVAIAVVVLRSTSAAPVRTFRAESATGVSGRAELHSSPTGTQIDLTASGLQGHERCILVAVTPDGSDIAGSWSATYEGWAQVDGTTAFPVSKLTALRIESAAGSLLLTIRV